MVPLTRRAFVAACLSAVPAVRLGAADQGSLAALEQQFGGRLGVAILDTHDNRRLEHRADERFPLLSTFKFLAAALVLQRVDHGEERLDRRVVYSAADLVPYSPITEQFSGASGMTVGALCEAAVTVSDNGAGNLLLRSFGGPAGLTRFARSLGDSVTRLDRIEPHLNDAIPGDARDTTSPRAMLNLMQELLFGTTLSAAARDQLAAWLQGATTGAARLRSSWPADWRSGDKTGTSANGVANDIAVL